MTDLNPHGKQMADESMIRTLDAQARAIWPQESALIRNYGLPDDIRILDAGCGTGEVSWRLAEMFPRSTVLGVDILDQSLGLARERYKHLEPRLTFENQSVYELDADDGAYDLTVNRHVIHSIPHPERVLAELMRVTRSGGRLHLIPEDYGMLHFQKGALDPRDMWHEGPAKFGEATGTDLFIGRNVYGLLLDLGLREITVDYAIVDTLRVPRETFAEILTAWRDGYAEPVAQVTRLSLEEAIAYFDQMIADVRDPKRYALWLVPVVSGLVP